MMQTETETHLMTIRTTESNIELERQKTEIVSLYSQIQQLQGMSGIN
jgi:hypothetical protein